MIAKQSILQSLVTFSNSQGERARGTLLKLERSTAVFEVYNPYSIVQLSEVLEGLRIRRGERTIYEGRAVVSNLVNTGLMLIVSVTVLDQFDDVDWLFSRERKEHIHEETERFVGLWRRSQCIDQGYQTVVSDIRSFFFELSRWMEPIDIKRTTGEDTSMAADNEIIEEMIHPVRPQAAELYERFELEAAKTPVEHLDYYKAYVQRDLHPLILRAPFPFRAFSKPLGYAGDFEMINMMLRDSCEGPTSYAKFIHKLYLSTGVAEAHRNRIGILCDMVTRAIESRRTDRHPVRVLNVGCGPAHELVALIDSRPELASAAHFVLVDFDSRALEHARSTIAEAARARGTEVPVDTLEQSVHELLKKALKRDASIGEGDYDLVYCAGLFDYLSDKVCKRMLRLFVNMLAPGGEVVATNVHPVNPYRYAMEHILEWYLIYRDRDEMLALASGLGHSETFCDVTGINVGLSIRRPGRADG